MSVAHGDEAWDTSVFSRVAPGSAAARRVDEHAATGLPIAITAAAWSEIIAGYERAARRARLADELNAAHAWQRAAVERGDVEVLALDEAAARTLGLIRAHASLTRSKAWDTDAAIAATCWVNGYTVVTRNTRDFDEIVEVMARAVGGRPLQVARYAVPRDS